MFDLEDDRIDRLGINNAAITPDKEEVLDQLGEDIMTRLMDQEADADILEKMYENEQISPEDL
jgi:hypothetical protein